MGKKRYAPEGARMGTTSKIVILTVSVLGMIGLVLFSIRLKANRLRRHIELETEEKQNEAAMLLNLLPDDIVKANHIIVIPGGGPGYDADNG